MADTEMSLIGNVVREPVLLKAANGTIFTRNSIACDSQRPDGNGGWISNDTTFMDITLFGDLAKNFCASVSKGTRITVQGRLQQRTVTNDDQSKRTFYGLVVDEVAISLKWVSVAKIVKRAGNGAVKHTLKASKSTAANTSGSTSKAKKAKKSKKSAVEAPF